ncbi:glutathione S-transferase Mu 2-like, partial [Lingula anatina]|uniref:Glutathione S-transferase Mu 2-like n=1 Tax=Lingula anatina TaxID=7574 RepID=A0A1S3JFP7_LINAN
NKAWKSVKYSLGLPFPNLPYLIDGDVKIITFVDFIAYDLFDIHRVFSPGCLDGYKNIADYMENFE